jgi:diguanylate cyclase (GGDEF)-like protein
MAITTLMGQDRRTSSALLPVYVGAVVAAGAIALAVAIATAPKAGLFGPRVAGFLLLATMLVLSEARPLTFLRLHEGSDITISWTFAFALVLFAPATALPAMAIASALGDGLRRRPPVRIAFNSAQMVLSLGAALPVLGLVQDGGLFDPGALSPLWLLVMLLGAAVAFLVNLLLTSVVIGLSERVPVWPLLRKGVTHNFSTDGMLLALAPVFALAAAENPLLVPLLVVAVWNVYRAANLALQRQHEATHDALTDLPNRRRFFEQVRVTHDQARRQHRSYAIALVDLDGFKQINDRLGHQIGDLVLQEVADRLRRARRSTDVVARLGGDEFAVLIGDVADADDALTGVERISKEFDPPFENAGFPLKLGASVGVAVFPEHGTDVELLLQHADEAMYDAKKSNDSSVQAYNSKRTIRHGRLALLTELERAIEERELVVHYQPKVDLRTGNAIGVEALVRWEHPRLGLVMPGEFMPLAEQTELMAPLTERVLEEALQQTAKWHAMGFPVSVAVNGSARNLHDTDFPTLVHGLLVANALDPRWLEIEVTENALLVDRLRAGKVLTELRSFGASVAIDDFGTGYSSLTNLRDLPVDRIKIDRSFVSDMNTETGDALIVASTVDLAGKLGLTSIAEGVENQAVWAHLTRLGCHIAQGFFIARPAPAEEITEWLEISFTGKAATPYYLDKKAS